MSVTRPHAPIELYGNASPNVVKVVLMLEEMQLPYRLKWVDHWKGEQFERWFIELNPNSKVPVVVDNSIHPPVTVFESGAILMYLAGKAAMLFPAAEPHRSRVLQWLMFQMSAVGPMFGQHNHFLRYASEVQPYARARYATEARRLLAVVEARLARAPFLAGDEYTIADVATYPWMRLLDYLELDSRQLSSIHRWMGTIARRPAARRTLARLTEMTPVATAARDAATPEQKDRLFGRVRSAG